MAEAGGRGGGGGRRGRGRSGRGSKPKIFTGIHTAEPSAQSLRSVARARPLPHPALSARALSLNSLRVFSQPGLRDPGCVWAESLSAATELLQDVLKWHLPGDL